MHKSSRYDPNKHHRRSVRLQGYDYAQAGMYFITICTHERECLFGKIVGAYGHTPLPNGVHDDTPQPQPNMQLNAYGEIVRDEWVKTPSLRPQVVLGEWVIMPNHLHGIILINDLEQGVLLEQGVWQCAPTRNLQSPSQTIGAIVRGFKSAVTKQINILRDTPGLPVWQRNYWEHIIRDGHWSRVYCWSRAYGNAPLRGICNHRRRQLGRLCGGLNRPLPNRSISCVIHLVYLYGNVIIGNISSVMVSRMRILHITSSIIQ